MPAAPGVKNVVNARAIDSDRMSVRHQDMAGSPRVGRSGWDLRWRISAMKTTDLKCSAGRLGSAGASSLLEGGRELRDLST